MGATLSATTECGTTNYTAKVVTDCVRDMNVCV